MALAIQVPKSSLYRRAVRSSNDVTHPILKHLYDYWKSRCSGRRCPARADLDPVDIPRLLPHILLVDTQPGADAFRVRLAGTEVVRWCGCEITGRELQDLPNSEIMEIFEEYRQTALNQEPRLSQGPLKNAFGTHKNVQRLLLPLSTDGATADMIIGGVIFDRSLISAPEEIDFPQVSSEIAAIHRVG